MELLKELLSSKKAMATVTAVIVYAAGRWGFDVDTAILDRIAAALMVFVGGQGLADIGKSAALISAKAAPVTSSFASAVTVPTTTMSEQAAAQLEAFKIKAAQDAIARKDADLKGGAL